MRTITITVTKEDWKNGKRGHPHFCPVALACKRVFETIAHGIYALTVSRSLVIITARTPSTNYPIELTKVHPADVRGAILDFDFAYRERLDLPELTWTIELSDQDEEILQLPPL